MLNVLARLLVSRSLDDNRPPPRWVARRLERSAELRRFAASSARLDRALEASPPPLEEPSPYLATRVRAAIERTHDEADDAGPQVWRSLAGAAACALALAGILFAFRVVSGPDLRDPPRIAARGSLSDLLRPLPASRSDVMASLEAPLLNEARDLLDSTREVARVVLARLPSPPELPR